MILVNKPLCSGNRRAKAAREGWLGHRSPVFWKLPFLAETVVTFSPSDFPGSRQMVV
jgi:hypothetical protein